MASSLSHIRLFFNVPLDDFCREDQDSMDHFDIFEARLRKAFGDRFSEIEPDDDNNILVIEFESFPTMEQEAETRRTIDKIAADLRG